MTKKLLIAFLWSAFVMIGCGHALPTSMEKMTVSRMRMADLESSATGYVYNSQRGQPASYVQYTNHGTGGYYDAPAPIQYVTYRKPDVISHPQSTLVDAVPGYHKEIGAHPTTYVVPLLEAPKKIATAPYYIPAKLPEKPLHLEILDDDVDEGDDGHGGDDHEGDVDSVDVDDGGEDHDDDEEEEEEHGGGEVSHNEEESSHGEKGDAGYRSHHKFDNGLNGDHHKDRHQGHYSEEGGNKKSHLDAAGNYNQHHEAEKAVGGESHGQKSYHKKGHKTTGFHNVYSKDEYKKDTDFYDDDHKSGYFDEHSSSDGQHSAAQGGYKKGDRHDSGYRNSEKGVEGHRDKGHEHSQHKGHKKAEGADSYHNNHADYATSSAAQGGRKYGYDKGQHK